MTVSDQAACGNGWHPGEEGPVCSCGDPTVVVTVKGELKAMCFSHTPDAGLLFDLPGRQA
jgi:hypothetical protein